MRNFRMLIVCGTLIALIIGGQPALAHEAGPLRSLDKRVGPYPVRVEYYTEPRGGQPLIFSIEPSAATSGLRYTVTAIPGTTVNAVPVRATVYATPDHPNGVEGSVQLPVSGQWLLSIEIDGPQGLGTEDVPVLAGAPPAIPEWLGWLIGLLPVWAMAGFILAQSRRAARVRPALAEAAGT